MVVLAHVWKMNFTDLTSDTIDDKEKTVPLDRIKCSLFNIHYRMVHINAVQCKVSNCVKKMSVYVILTKDA